MSILSDVLDSLIGTCLLISIVIFVVGCSLLFNDEGTDIFRGANCICPCYECCYCCDDWKDESDCSQDPHGFHRVVEEWKEENTP
jgi:hypothetical protein